MQTEGPPGEQPLLPVVCLQEGDVRHVRPQDPGHQEIQAVLGVGQGRGFTVYLGLDL